MPHNPPKLMKPRRHVAQLLLVAEDGLREAGAGLPDKHVCRGHLHTLALRESLRHSHNLVWWVPNSSEREGALCWPR